MDVPGGHLAGLTIAYPADLPVSERRDDIVSTLRDHRVVIVAGETGSGKTTQIPKMLLEALAADGVGDRRPRIAHTQPRRIAARAVAERLADELGATIGGDVGYRVRFTDRTSRDTAVTVMTDGVLLASIRRDRLLRDYDAIIVDEAHERSLNIDFLLGYLRWLLPQRPDLRIVITSATLDTRRFSEHFGGAPVIEVEGRTYPVEIRYRPAEDIEEIEAIGQAVDELLRDTDGDVLVFLSGEREIRDAADALSARPGIEVVPLYGRLSASEQHRVFAPHDSRRVVLATNVAETSLTVPGIRSVIDTGRVRLSRFSTRLRVQRLPIEPISQASAAQRAGRCGRLGPGVCIRLYAEDDLLARPEFTDPEILRTNLASVLLSMGTLGLGEVAEFPFLDPPDRRAVAAGIAILEEVGALRPAARSDEPLGRRVTRIGRDLARLPIDPRLGRMVLQAQREGCIDDVVVIAAALAIRDPRERPADRAGAADAAHRRFADPTSDLLTLLNLWDHLESSQASLSSTRFRAQCREEFIHFLRVREWQDLVSQIRHALGLRGAPSASNRDGDAIHRAVLAGLLSHIGLRAADADPRRAPYLGARSSRFWIWPGSVLATSKPAWVVAAELVETGRLWGRMAARIDPAWVEALAGPLAQRSYSEPMWSPRHARAQCVERVTVYGLPVVTGRRIPLDRLDRRKARELFILHALVRDEWKHDHEVLHANATRLEEARERAERARVVHAVDEDALVRFFDDRVPEDVTSGRAFDAWWRRHGDPAMLELPSRVLESGAAEADFPGAWPDTEWPLTYRFAPGDPRDGVTVHLPVSALAGVPPDAFAAQVPGYREDMLVALCRALPKPIRRALGPAPDAARALRPHLDPRDPRRTLTAGARRAFGIDIAPRDWPFDGLPGHLRPTIAVEDEDGREIAAGKDLESLRRQCATETVTAIRRALPHIERDEVREWPDIPWDESGLAHDGGSRGAVAYPGLVPASGGSVALRVFPTIAARDAAHVRGVARLVCLLEPLRVKDLRLTDREMLLLARNPQGSVRALLDDASEAVVRDLIDEAGGAPLTAEEFTGLKEAFRGRQVPAVRTLLRSAIPALESWWRVRSALDGDVPMVAIAAYDDASAQLDRLVSGRVLTRFRERGLADLTRYLRALERRIDALPADAARDLLRMEQAHRVEDALARLPEDLRADPEAGAILEDIEELRVSLWAQDLGTRSRISEKRLLDRVADLARSPTSGRSVSP